MAYMKDSLGRRLDSFEVARDVPPGSRSVAGRVTASAMASPPTITASSTQVLTKFVAPDWSGYRISGAPQYQKSGLWVPRRSIDLSSTYDGWAGGWRREFDFDGPKFEFQTTPRTDSRLVIWVDDQPHTLTPLQLSSLAGVTVNSGIWITVDFGSRARRRIMIDMIGTGPVATGGAWTNPDGPVSFGSLVVANTDSVTPPSTAGPRIVWVGDSIAAGAGQDGSAQQDRRCAYTTQAAWRLGIADSFNHTSQPSTGLVQQSGGFGGYESRFGADVAPLAPDILVLQCSINDAVGWPAHQAALGPAFDSYVARVRDDLPGALLVAISPIIAGTPLSEQITVRDITKARASALGVPYIDCMDTTTPVFFGTGRVGSTTGDGNADYYREASSVKTRPNPAGHAHLGAFVAREMQRILRLRSL